ncbi:pyruvate, phosphate dikinase [Candidatus Gracilibacteria bacterium]|nr:pyruvate, phosphate dikinase [Candidatus Gracilibacteria bacterium]MCF7856547.1 pyruvate, phosphate dikinase [Candidatus Gracilibacteria bacterium]MCF7896870.1 pyruvate, phosphate dikinase [Candidatus Gracilibacteria bacterium]
MKRIYDFTEGNASMKELLGGKGANLAEMSGLKIPVPPGFTITTATCDEYAKSGGKFPKGLMEEVEKYLAKLEKKMGKKLGDADDPLLVSVRSGAAVSMPGMMDTILNLGINDKSVVGLAAVSGNERFAWDSYRRFIQMFGDVVLEVSHEKFEAEIEKMKKARKVKNDVDLDAEDLRKLVTIFKKVVHSTIKKDFPQNPLTQLKLSIEAVFRSWNNPRAVYYREMNKIKGLIGTAVNVQAMVFGNLGNDSGTGVAFTRSPSNGENKFYGEYLMNAQGEDVVAGIRTPEPISHLQKQNPKIYAELTAIYKKLEKHYRDMQDMEFTIERGKLFLLQTRTGKRTAKAAVRIAVELVREKMITEKEAVLRVDPYSLDQLLHPMLDPKAKKVVIAKGLPASPGAACGTVVFTADEAERLGKRGKAVILVRKETSPEDIHGMNQARGILTARGGMTSHAAVVARGMGKCCVAGAEALEIDSIKKVFCVAGKTVREGDTLTLNGSTGEVILGKIATVEPKLDHDFAKLMSWADKFRTLKVRTNADTPHDAEFARSFGAEGIGLTRTEHMFFQPERILAVREMIVAENVADRKKALAKLLPYQREDFYRILKAMRGLPVTIRLLDPPLHEFLPQEDKEIRNLAKDLKVTEKKLRDRIAFLHEVNPMMGMRGARLMIVYPEIVEMQSRAIFEAAVKLKKEKIDVIPEIMIPIVGMMEEFHSLAEVVRKTGNAIIQKSGVKLKYAVGTMIEIPRACIRAKKIARQAEFFSFGTNDLTQLTFGFSRDDAPKFVPFYIEKGILEVDPFVSLDQRGVGELVQMGIERGRRDKKDLKCGICGEHGGDPASIEFCHRVGMNYVSCSPFRVPIARLAAAQAALR